MARRVTMARPRATRCLVCNAPPDAVPAGEACTLLPPAARDLGGPVRRCPSCGRVYWPGSYTRRMRRSLAEALPGWPLPPDDPSNR
jgi:hypothetical protein